jgi:transposase
MGPLMAFGTGGNEVNVLKPHEVTEIETLLKAGLTARQISRRFGYDRDTVAKYAKANGFWREPVVNSKPATPATGSGQDVGCLGAQNPPPPATGSDIALAVQAAAQVSESACEPFRIWIVDQVKLGRNAVAIYQDLVERNSFTNAYNSVKRFVSKLKQTEPEQFDRLEFLPGEETQVDYGQGAPTLHPSSGKYRKPRLFVMTLKYSRKSFRKVIWKSSQEAWARLHEEAFIYFGGVSQYTVLDNLKEGVLKPDLYEPELNPLYAAVLAHYGSVADPARVRDPNRKGTVECAIQHTQNTALKGRKFESIEEQNKWLMHWEEVWASKRIHGRMKRQVAEMYQEELPHLGKLPLVGFRYFAQESRTVHDDGCIQVGHCYYGASPLKVGTHVLIRIYSAEIEIIDPQTLMVVRRHMKLESRGKFSTNEMDEVFNPTRRTESLLIMANQIGPHTERFCEQLMKQCGRLANRSIRNVLSLARKNTAREIEAASELAMERGVTSAKTIRRWIESTQLKNAKPPAHRLQQAHELIRGAHEYDDFWNWATEQANRDAGTGT